MNLRLEKDSIRVRVNFAEAERLAREGQLREELPMPGGAISLCVSSIVRSDLCVQAAGDKNGVVVGVPVAAIQAMLAAFEAERVNKAELELHAQTKIGAATVHLCFEVDRFSKKGSAQDRKEN